MKSLNLRIQRDRIRDSLTCVDPRNTAMRWASVITRRLYSVPGPNSLWHIDGTTPLLDENLLSTVVLMDFRDT